MQAQITERELNGERVITLDQVTLIASKSEPGVWHAVTVDHCDCRGWEFRHSCRHIAVAEALAPKASTVPTGKAALDFLNRFAD